MKKIILIMTNRTRYIVNKMLYDNNKPVTKKRSFLAAFLSIAILILFFVFLNSILNFTFNFLTLHLSILSLDEKVLWTHALLLVFLSTIIFSDIYNTYYRFFTSNDTDFLMQLPLSMGEVLVGKIIERTYLKVILTFMILVFIIYKSMRSNRDGSDLPGKRETHPFKPHDVGSIF
ncbi:hypothetical protein QA612_22350 [Evansella sp. AB-P1]|uniref:hypothetical protein n=1 Tax=Evansella sp. AB-P1 TaxID=3037653 RepID=UPI00241D0648|nr:hypothetical protein [Evansella sp. AB-P1]MDG5790185.1 hypothetical protein [Evansella sp. AB-P1]